MGRVDLDRIASVSESNSAGAIDRKARDERRAPERRLLRARKNVRVTDYTALDPRLSVFASVVT